MGQKAGEMSSDQIKRDIDRERAYLGKNLEQLDEKLNTALDWRAQVQKNLTTLLAIAFGAGVLLSMLTGGRCH